MRIVPGEGFVKNILLIPVLLLTLSPFPASAAPEAPAIEEWQGQWGQWSSPDGGHNLYGASVSIFACDASASTCRFRFDSESPASRCSTSGDNGSVLQINGSTAKGEILSYDGSHSGCYLQFEKVQAPGKRELRLLGRPDSACEYFCTEHTLNFPSAYPFRTAVEYPLLSTRECFADSRKSREVWCADPKVQELDETLKTQGERIDDLINSNEMYNKLPGRREQILAQCDRAVDIGACLSSSYQNILAELGLAEKKAQEAHDKDEEAMETPGDPAAASELIGRIDGVYKERFANQLVDGQGYESEDILEIVRVSENTVYFRTHLEFYNGHECNLWGLARFSRKGVLVYDDPEPPLDPEDPHCRLQFEVSADKITILDPKQSCKSFNCGMRGAFDGEDFALSARRPIKYMQLLKNSEEYKKALEQLKQ